MGLDIRLPIGLMFCVLAQLLLLAGWLEPTPINTYTGATMLVFGAIMLVLYGYARKSANKAAAHKVSASASK